MLSCLAASKAGAAFAQALFGFVRGSRAASGLPCAVTASHNAGPNPRKEMPCPLSALLFLNLPHAGF